MNDHVSIVLRQYLVNIPLFLVWTVGFGLALMNWRRSPKASGLMIGGVFVAFVTGVLGPLISLWESHLYSGGMSREDIQLVSLLAAIFLRFWEAVSWLLIIIAVTIALRRKPDFAQPA
ncbi:MAG TPA: hypothetical protein VI756_04080 [Blastocatellia bacterium]